MELITARLVLREVNEGDYAALCALYADPAMRRFEGPLLDAAQVQRRLKAILASQAAQPRIHYFLAITLPPDEFLRGWVTLTLIHPEIREYEIGWAVQPQDWSKGFATEAAAMLLKVAFSRLNAHRVIALCQPENGASARVMEKLGMQREGLLRQTHPFGDGWRDELLYASLGSPPPRSPLDVAGVDVRISADDIVHAVREGREPLRGENRAATPRDP
jgi:[ribosomal protein S5]-alanine N-acetyltransferase